MSFTITDLDDLKQLLRGHPEWRAELRELNLTDELVDLPRAFAEARASYEARFERIERALAQLTERVDQLAQAQVETSRALRDLVQEQGKLTDRVGRMDGMLLESRYAERASGYFGSLLRRIRVILPYQLDERTEDALEAHLTPDERDEVRHLDILVSGRLHHPSSADQAQVYLAVEVSVKIDENDVQRAFRRAQLLQKAGLRAVPVVAGEGITQRASELLFNFPVALVIDGRSVEWERALAAVP